MSVTLGFIPWARLGLGAAVHAQPGALRAQLPIEVQVGGLIGAAEAPAVKAPFMAQTLGPGDVLGIDPRVVIRTDPGPYAQGTPAHAFVAVEFSRPDFPWMFSPLAADAQQRLQPWLCLVVVPQRAGISLRPREGKLPVLAVDSGDELPNLAEAWAWAHVQTLSEGTAAPPSTIAAGDARTISRLVSPRRLERLTSYYACLVPTFNVGRQVGLDPTAEPAGPLAPAWAGSIAPNFEIPVYYSWTFNTGETADFHDLVAKLQPQVLPADVGSRPVTVGFPAADAQSGSAPFTASFEGALGNIKEPPAVSDETAAASFGHELVRVIGLPHVVTPPRYGQSHAPDGAPWLDQLNLTPVARIAAATGARVVQAQQESLIGAAWDQIGEIQRVNQQRRQADLALSVGERLMQRHVAVMTTARVMQVAAPTGVPGSGGTAAATTIADVPAASLDAAFRRLQRRTGSLARRSTPVFTSAPVIGMMGIPPSQAASAMTAIPRARIELAGPDFVAAKNPAVIPFPEGDGEPSGRTSAHVVYKWSGFVPANIPAGRFRPSTITEFTSIFGAAVPWRLDDGQQFVTDPNAAALVRRQAIAANFKAAAQAIQTYIVRTMLLKAMSPFQPAPPDAEKAAKAAAAVLSALSPARALVARAATFAAISVSAPRALGIRIDATPADPPSGPAALAPLRYDPTFPQGMYRALAELSPDLFLVGADHVPDNSIGLVRTNTKFIEAYLVGLNHEMGRELLWRGFPSDGRGTYFRRFWDTDNYPLLSAWRNALGANVSMPDWLALVIRGEIVRRFPRATVFAQRGTLDSTGAQFVPAPEPRRYPMFRVTLRGDLLCVGFDLTRAEAASCFFGIEEQMTEARFAAPIVPADSHLAVAELSLPAAAHAGDVALATLRRPVRVLIDPRRLIP